MTPQENDLNQTLLHYIYDPLCGWCYGAAPLVKAARDLLPVQAHAGGMMSDARRQPVTAALRAFVLPHDRRIAQLTGQPFGPAYADGLLRDTTAVFDSEPPIAAVLAADAIAGRGLDLLARLQRAHYVEGGRIADTDVLVDMAVDIGLAQQAFVQALEQARGAPVQAHIHATRELMARIGAQGFPTLTLERDDGSWQPVDVARFFGRPQDFAAHLRDLAPGAAPAELPAPACNIDGCNP